MTDTEMDMGIHTTQSGFPYSDAVETLILYEFRQIDPRSKKTVIRVSYSLDWINRPFLIDKLVENMANTKVTEGTNYFHEYLDHQCEYIKSARTQLFTAL